MLLEASIVTALVRVISDWRRPEEGICAARYTGMFSLWKFTGLYINGIAIFFLSVYYGPKKSQKEKEPVILYQKSRLKVRMYIIR